jgi:hypothetical protein
MSDRDSGGFLLRSGAENEATRAGAMIGWILLAVPAVWLCYGTGVWAGYCDQADHLTNAVLANIAAVILLGLWVNRLRHDRDQRQGKLDKCEEAYRRALQRNPTDSR